MRRFVVSMFLVLGACKHEPEVVPPAEPEAPVPAERTAEAPAPPAPVAAPADAGPPAAPVEAKLELPELPPAPALPPSPPFLPDVQEPADNPTTPEKAQLGYLLFFDKRASKDDSMACAGCHFPDKAYTDDRAVSAKVGGALNKRNAPMVTNLAFHATFYWDGRMPTLEAVSNAAWKGQLGADPAAVSAKLNAIPKYRAHFHRAFGGDASPDNVPKAYAAFFRALKTGNAPFDKYEQGDKKAVSKDAVRGFEVFKNAGCALCHVPPMYSDFDYHNVGIGMEKAEGERDKGRTDATKDAKDEGKFKTPSMRDVAKTWPYFHDGSAKTLDEAIDFMLAGGRKNPNLDEKLKPKKLSKKDRAALKAFLESLSGTPTYTAAPTEFP